MSQTIWRVEPINASWHPAILTRCPLCKANGTQSAPFEQFYHAGKHRRGTVEMGLQWARDFRLLHHPTCPRNSAQYQADDAAQLELDAPRHQVYLLEEAVSQAKRELDRAYISKLPSIEIAQIERKVESARTDLERGRTRLAPLIAALECKLADAQAALENARGESAPEKTLAEFGKAMAKYLPPTDAQPERPGVHLKPLPNILHV